MGNKKLILFDLDGVLLNSKQNMLDSWSSVQREFSIKTPFEDYFKNIGRPFSEIMKILGHENIAGPIESVYKKTSINNIDKLAFYDGTNNVLNKLIRSGYILGIVTSKDLERTKLILDKLNIEFSIVQSPDESLRGKPAPDHLMFAMAKTNIDPSDTVYIGDMSVDFLAAKRAGVDYLHAAWGYSPDIYEKNVISLNSLEDIFDYLKGV